MREKNCKTLLIMLIGMLFWIIYLFDSEMSGYGMYSIVSYNQHVLLVIVPFLSVIITIGWMMYILVQLIKKKDVKSNLIIGLLILVLGGAQISYILNQAQLFSVSSVASIESINEQKMEIVIKTEERSLTLDCPMLVQNLVETDGTQYYITYEWNKDNPNYGKLCMIQAIN